jgi:hypothetical protein
MRTPRLSKPEAHLLQSPEPGRFVAAELERLPEPARRHLAQAIAPGTPLVTSARLRMRGHIKVGRWPAGDFFRYQITDLEPVIGQFPNPGR